ncbi:MAG: redox-sensing transcriptional repressor Rex [Candidatus Kapaibacterium sp.]
MKKISEKTINRLITYRQILNRLIYDGVESIFSHKLAELSGNTPAQVRRDLMVVGYNGTPVKGYRVDELEKSIGYFIDDPEGQKIAIIGLGNLGTSLLNYCYWRYPNISLLVAFDKDKDKIREDIYDCHIYHINLLEQVVKEEEITLAILSVPPAEAQSIADRLVNAGIKGIINYSSLHLNVPGHISYEEYDMLSSVQKIGYLTRNKLNLD